MVERLAKPAGQACAIVTDFRALAKDEKALIICLTGCVLTHTGGTVRP